MDRESVITHLQIIKTWALFAREHDLQFFTNKHLEDIAKWSEDASSMLKDLAAKPPVHVHEEYTEHDWKRNENGEIDEFASEVDYHSGPFCKRCYYTFCIYCDPNGWNKEPCVIDMYKCPKCGRCISKSTKFCPDCGQEMKWQ